MISFFRCLILFWLLLFIITKSSCFVTFYLFIVIITTIFISSNFYYQLYQLYFMIIAYHMIS